MRVPLLYDGDVSRPIGYVEIVDEYAARIDWSAHSFDAAITRRHVDGPFRIVCLSVLPDEAKEAKNGTAATKEAT